LRKAPRKIADEIVAGLGPIEGFEKFEVAAPDTLTLVSIGRRCSVARLG